MSYDYHIFTIVAAFIILDIITGFSQACANKTISSIKMRQGLWHKCAYIITIVLALLCEHAVAYLELGFDLPLTIPVCSFIALTEIVSVIENIGKLNPEIATSGILDFFSQNKNRRKDD